MGYDPADEEAEATVVDGAVTEGAARGPGEAPPPPRSYGRYVIIDELGRGGMGVVYRAYDPKLHREVALKLLSGSHVSRVGQARQVREARAMAQLSHPNVVSIYDVEIEECSVVLAMEFVRGRTLGQWMEQDRPDWRAVLRAFEAAGLGLAAAHAAALLHRDFKPANVLVGDDGRVRVTDFGLATRPSESSPGSAEDSGAARGDRSHLPTSAISGATVLTEEGMVMGTPRYMAPEQHTAGPLTPAADQYAFAVALWEALCGTPPFTGPSMAHDKALGPGPWPKSALVPPRIVAAIRRALSPRPTDRWPTMSAFLAALRPPPARRRPLMLRVGAATAAGAIAIAIAIAARARSHASDNPMCADAADPLAGIWSPSLAQDAGDALRRTGHPAAASSWTRTAAALDEYAQALRAQTVAICIASDGDPEGQTTDRAFACVRQRALRFDGVVTAIVGAGADGIPHMRDTVDTLARGWPATTCSDPVLLAEDPSLAHAALADPALAARREAVDTELFAAHANYELGRPDTTLQHIDAARHQAGNDGDPYISASIALWAAIARPSGPDRLPALRRAYQRAREGGEDRIAVLAALELLHEAILTRQVGEAVAWYAVADAEIGRWRIPPARLHVHRLQLLVAQEHFEEAAEFGAALVDELNAVDEIPLYRTIAYQEHGNALSALGRHADALAQMEIANEIGTHTHGGDHINVLGNNVARAMVLVALERFTEAIELLEASVEALERMRGPYHSNVIAARGNLAAALGSSGQQERALAEFETLARRNRESPTPDLELALLAEFNAAITLQALGRCPEALPILDRLRATWQLDSAMPNHRTYAMAFLTGQCERAAGNMDRALAQLQRAHRDAMTIYGTPHYSTGDAAAELGRTHLAAGAKAEGLRWLAEGCATLDEVEGHLSERKACHADLAAARRPE